MNFSRNGERLDDRQDDQGQKDQEIEDQDGCIKKNSRQGERAQTICG
jgi:hypothetical protein